jgi:hypothetical protein
MDYLKLFYSCGTFFIAQILVWFQVYGPINIEWLKDNRWICYASAIPITMLFMKGVDFGYEAFGGVMWPARFLTFSMGAISFAFLTAHFNQEVLSAKTLVCLALSVGIILIQILWK